MEATGDKDDVISDETLSPDDVIKQIGGCGRFQIILSVTVQLMKSVICFGMISSTFFAFVPKWRCADSANKNISHSYEAVTNNSTIGYSLENVSTAETNFSEYENAVWNKQCKTPSGVKCAVYEFETDVNTVATQFGLICDLSWVMSTAISIQMVGMCVANLLAGQFADTIGRKRPLFSAMVILFLAHLMAYFSPSWEVYVASRFIVGFGSGVFMTIQHNIQSEYSLSKWRAIIVGFPSWPLESCVYALIAWLIPDWQYLTLITSLLALSFLSAWFFVPESFRWLLAHERHAEAAMLVKNVARWNGKPVPDIERMLSLVSIAKNQEKKDQNKKKYSLIDIFRRRELRKITAVLMFVWLTMGMAAYGITFGIQKLSGSIYLNLFLFNISAVPSKLIIVYIQNRFGRKMAAMLCMGVCGLGALTVGIVQIVDTPHRASLTNYFALVANAGVHAIWGPVQTLTVELYPTVVRNIGFGFLQTLARIGAILGPQLVYLSEFVPGLMYFVVGLSTLLSILGTLWLPETNNANLKDKLSDDHKT